MKAKWIVLLSLAGILVIARLTAPFFLENRARERLKEIEGYSSRLEDIDLRLYRGAYIIDSVTFVKEGAGFPEPFMAARKVEVMVDWDALFGHGELVANVEIIRGELNFAVQWAGQDQNRKIKQFGRGVEWLERFKKLSPLDFNRLTVKDSRITYSDYTTDPSIRIALDHIQIDAGNLQNVERKATRFPGQLDLTANLTGGGKVDLRSGIHIRSEPMEMDMNLKVEGIDVVDWNDLMTHYSGLDFESGKFYLYTEIRTTDGSVNGYLKPVIENARLFDPGNESGTFFDRTWEAIAGGITEVFENQKKEQLSSRVPLSGSLESAEADAWTAFWNILSNAFVEAFEKELEFDIDPDESS